jgi:hypothetical protein
MQDMHITNYFCIILPVFYLLQIFDLHSPIVFSAIIMHINLHFMTLFNNQSPMQRQEQVSYQTKMRAMLRSNHTLLLL